jgi:FMN-dependent NADH-azoreductase
MSLRLLRIDASPRGTDSVSRGLADELVTTLRAAHAGLEVTERDLATAPPPWVDAAWVDASNTEPGERSPAQRAALAESDRLVGELLDADLLVIATPVHNFGVPATLKAWIDQVARSRLTFRYTSEGPIGLLRDKRAWLVVSSGGTGLGGPTDFASTHLRHVLGFLGVHEVELIAADRLGADPEGRLEAARARIQALARPAPSAVA